MTTSFDHLEHEVATHGHDCYKNSNVTYKYEIASADGTCPTLEGDVQYMKGHYLMAGSKGEVWAIEASKFLNTYDVIDSTHAQPRHVMRRYIIATDNGALQASYGVLTYSPGDYIVRYGFHDYGVVAPAVFIGTYVIG
jgi:hypothetical protein